MKARRTSLGVRLPSRSRSQAALYRAMNSPIFSLPSSRLWKSWRYRHASLNVRIHRSMIPLHSGSPTYAGVEPRHVPPPQLIGPVRLDASRVGPVPVRMAPPNGGQKAVEPHEPKHPGLAHPCSPVPKPHAHLPVPSAQELARAQDLPDGFRHLFFRPRRLAPAFLASGQCPHQASPLRVEGRTRQPIASTSVFHPGTW